LSLPDLPTLMSSQTRNQSWDATNGQFMSIVVLASESFRRVTL
jgi:hypothetical protein